MILILSSADDPHADQVERHLAEAAAPFRRVDLAGVVSLSVSSPDETHARLGTADVASVRAVWVRRPSVPSPPVAPRARPYATTETQALFVDALTVAPAAWLPALPHIARQADRKTPQLKAASRLGLGIPPTLITTDYAAALDFFRQHDGSVITKLPSSSPCVSGGEDRVFRYTEKLSVHRLASLRADLHHSPVMLQGLVPKHLELRVTVVGDEVFAAAIDSQVGARTRTDWRRYGTGTSYQRHELPALLRQQCLELVHGMGLHFGAIDLILTPTGDYVFLELNPNGQWLWVEKLTGLPIAAAICRTLISLQERS